MNAKLGIFSLSLGYRDPWKVIENMSGRMNRSWRKGTSWIYLWDRSVWVGSSQLTFSKGMQVRDRKPIITLFIIVYKKCNRVFLWECNKKLQELLQKN